MKVVFDPRARDDLEEIFAWIGKDSVAAARRMVARIEAKIAQLEAPELAGMGRPGLVVGTRELIERPYIIVYRIDEQRREIVIVAVTHGAQARIWRED